jgi:hypothetical protein
VHPGAGDLVDADEQRLSGLPSRRTVFDEILGDLVETLIGRDDLVVLAEELIEKGGLIGIEFGFFDLRRDPVVQIEARHAQFLATVLIAIGLSIKNSTPFFAKRSSLAPMTAPRASVSRLQSE